MLFNSIDFALFFTVIFIIYWLFKNNLKAQNIILLIGSYVFYGWWDYRFLSLILISSLTDYLCGIEIEKSKYTLRRNFFLIISILVNLGMLGFFKYYNFFLDNIEIVTNGIANTEYHFNSLQIILPVGISFYTFQTMSYTFDVYFNKIDSKRNIINFLAYVSFFPQLVAGPIERASNLLPQFEINRHFDYNDAVKASQLILWGLFKKVVIADNCAKMVNEIFQYQESFNSSTLVIGTILFAFQIYGDFSGYSDIAIGTAKLLGFNLKRNFSYPYFSRDIAEFWRRWHISLSTWFRDYLYIPIGGSRGSLAFKIRNTLLIFIVSGFWHGANWTFIVWGALNAFYFLPLLISGKNRVNLDIAAKDRFLPTFRESLGILTTFSLTSIAWVFFRSESLAEAIQYLIHMFSFQPGFPEIGKKLFLFIMVFVIIEWIGRDEEQPLIKTLALPKFGRWFIYYIIVFLIIYNSSNKQDFIYFQF